MVLGSTGWAAATIGNAGLRATRKLPAIWAAGLPRFPAAVPALFLPRAGPGVTRGISRGKLWAAEGRALRRSRRGDLLRDGQASEAGCRLAESGALHVPRTESSSACSGEGPDSARITLLPAVPRRRRRNRAAAGALLSPARPRAAPPVVGSLAEMAGDVALISATTSKIEREHGRSGTLESRYGGKGRRTATTCEFVQPVRQPATRP
jgi:hypothetical protein